MFFNNLEEEKMLDVFLRGNTEDIRVMIAFRLYGT